MLTAVSEAEAVLTLLHDPDPAVRGPLVQRLVEDAGLRDRCWAACAGDAPAALLDAILRADALTLIEAWGACSGLEEGWSLLAWLHAPRQAHAAACAAQLDALASRAPRQNAGAVARWLCQDVAFAGDREAYDDPRNSHLPEVLARRAGLPIAVTGVWLLVCRRLGLPCRALAMPAHVFAAWDGGAWDLFTGQAVSAAQLERWARTHGAASAEPFLGGASDSELLQRMARNLAAAYARRDDLVRGAIAAVLARSV
jgi:hypothetical protein